MQRLRWIYMLLLLPLLLLPIPDVVAANVATVTLDRHSTKYRGDLVTVSGTTTLTEVTIKVVRPDRTIEYFDIVTANGGKFAATFSLPVNAQTGTYSIVAGKGSEVASTTFFVVAATDTGPITTPGTPTTPGIGNPAKPLVVFSSGNTSNGQTGTIAIVNAELLQKAIGAASAANSIDPAVLIEIKGVHPLLEVKLPASVINDAAKTSPGAVIIVHGDKSSYRLPVNLPALQSKLQDLGVKPEEATITIRIEAASDKLRSQMNDVAKKSNISLRDGGYVFTLIVGANGKTMEVPSFGDVHVTRTLTFNGTISPSNATAVFFDPITSTYHFVPSVFKTVDGVTTVTIQHNGNGVAYAVIESDKTFADLSEHWAKADIELLAAKQIVFGTDADRFNPNEPITRAEFTAMLVRALGLSINQIGPSFSDIPADSWYAGAINAALKAKLVDGTGNGNFLPNEPVTREQMATILASALQAVSPDKGQKQPPAKQTFTDESEISSWAQKAVSFLSSAQIVKGFPDGTFGPDQHASRAQTVFAIKRLLQSVEFIN
jgi:S-layer homology domain